MSHSCLLRVRFYELDPYGHVNHSAYVQYFEVARVEALAAVGMGLSSLQTNRGLKLVVVEIHTRFIDSAVMGDDLIVESGISKIERARVTWVQRLVRDNKILATQQMLSACVGVEGKPLKFPSELLAAIAIYQVSEDWLCT